MAAPSGTTWGNVVQGSKSGQQGKIGIYIATSATETLVKTTVQIWFATMYSCYDKSITLKLNSGENVSSATTTVVSSKDINHTVDTGRGWSTSNQTKLYEYTTSTGWSRYHTQRTINFCASLSGIDMLSGKTMQVSKSIVIKAKSSYTVSYNANGGSGAPSSQTKWYGETLTLRASKPSRTGYTFKGWSTSSTATTATWRARASYTVNASDTLYAVWQVNTYTVSYNANGGTGAPSAQTKTYGKALTLSSSEPTKTNYNFKGWATSSAATTVAYSAGESYTVDAAVILYAVWELAYVKPRITNLTVSRVDTNGNLNNYGTKCLVKFNWAVDSSIKSIVVLYKQKSSSDSSLTQDTVSLSYNTSAKTGSISQVLNGVFDISTTYTIVVRVTDTNDSNNLSCDLTSGKYVMDFKSGGDGIAIGKAAENAGFEVAMDTIFEKSVTTRDEIEIYGPQPHLDFHFGNTSRDYTSRIIETESGKIDILAPNGLMLNGANLKYDDTAVKNRLSSVESADAAMKKRLDTIENSENITLSVVSSRLTRLTYTAKYIPMLGMVFVRIYGKVNANMNTGYDYNVLNIGSRSPSANAALAVKCGKNTHAIAQSSGVISLRPFESGINGYDIYITGFWFI